MTKSRKLYHLTLTLLLSLVVISRCYGAPPPDFEAIVSVDVSPDSETVMTRISGATNDNTAEFYITATVDVESQPHIEHKEVEDSWSLDYSVKFTPPVGVKPVPKDPGDPVVEVPGGENGGGGEGEHCWTVPAHSSKAGKWEITFIVTVDFEITDSLTSEEKTISVSGAKTCTLEVYSVNLTISAEEYIPEKSELNQDRYPITITAAPQPSSGTITLVKGGDNRLDLFTTEISTDAKESITWNVTSSDTE